MNALEIATKMETDAISFYTEAARKTNHPIGKKMFQAIVEDEKRHLEMIARLIKGLEISPLDLTPIDRIQSVFQASKREMMQRIEVTTDELEAFRIAMEMERQGKALYEKVHLEAKTDREKVFFENLIREEQAHYRMFFNTYQYLSDTGNWFLWEERGIVEGG
jgi:rubrerythrin